MNISIMLKPASSNCNLRCKYCFYNDLSSHREMPSHGMMSEQTLRATLKKAFDFAGHDRVMLSFQGGEPLLAGKEFFLKLHDIIRELNVNRAPVSIGVQTNGTLIDDEWCRIFKRGGYLVGLSLDGDEVADSLRIDANGNPTFSRALNGAKLMQKYGVDFNILVVLTKQVANRIEPIYRFFKKQNFKHLQFIPMLKPLRVDESGKPISKTTYNEAFPSEQENYSMSAEDYSEFLQKCFAMYLKDCMDGKYTSIRQFDNFVRLAHFECPEQCGMEGHCCHQFVIEGGRRGLSVRLLLPRLLRYGQHQRYRFLCAVKAPRCNRIHKRKYANRGQMQGVQFLSYVPQRLQARAYRPRQMRRLQKVFRLRLAALEKNQLIAKTGNTTYI